ncbi:hypothetical protein DESC_120142 [Desulfosarcina cetonica]|nr:hypothetical protein DESC_120142 [Desulfosarcina cetonica]
MPESIHVPHGNDAVDPLALDGKKSGTGRIGAGVLQIDFVVGRVEIAGNDQAPALLTQAFGIGEEGLVEIEFVLQARIVHLAVGEIDVKKAEVIEFQLDDAPLVVEPGDADAVAHRLGRQSRIGRHATVALLHRGEGEGRIVAVDGFHGPGELVLLELGFLQPQDVDIQIADRFQKFLLHDGAVAVDIPGNELDGLLGHTGLLADQSRIDRKLGSTMAVHADFRAHLSHRAATAKGGDRSANHLAKGHQELVIADPVAFGQLLAQGHLGLVRRAGLHVADAVADTVHMGIHANGRNLEPLHEHQIGGLAAHAGQRGEGLQGVGHLSVVSVQQDPADLQQALGLGGIESHRVDPFLDRLRCQPEHGLGGAGHGEKAFGGQSGDLVLGAQGEECGDQHLEGRRPTGGDKGDDGRIPLAVVGFDGGDKAIDIEGALSGHGS